MDPKVQLNSTDGVPLTNSSQYRKLIARLLYLTLFRPDIMFVVHRFSKFLSKPRTPYLQAAHHLLRYIKDTPRQGLFFAASSKLQLQAFSNADWVFCPDSRRFTW